LYGIDTESCVELAGARDELARRRRVICAALGDE
jgi:hypothetical protein